MTELHEYYYFKIPKLTLYISVLYSLFGKLKPQPGPFSAQLCQNEQDISMNSPFLP